MLSAGDLRKKEQIHTFLMVTISFTSFLNNLSLDNLSSQLHLFTYTYISLFTYMCLSPAPPHSSRQLHLFTYSHILPTFSTQLYTFPRLLYPATPLSTQLYTSPSTYIYTRISLLYSSISFASPTTQRRLHTHLHLPISTHTPTHFSHISYYSEASEQIGITPSGLDNTS